MPTSCIVKIKDGMGFGNDESMRTANKLAFSENPIFISTNPYPHPYLNS